MKIEYRVCDRCGKEINNHKLHSCLYKSKPYSKLIRITHYFGLAGSSDYKYELCKDCTEKLEVFLKNKD